MIQNQWLEIALYPGCVQGFFLTYLLWKKKDANQPAIRYFTALLLTLSVLMLLRVSFQPAFIKIFAAVLLLPDVVLFLTGPLIYLFTRALLRLEPLPPNRLYLHFIPAAVHVLIVNTWMGLHLNGFLHYLDQHQLMIGFELIEASALASMAIYLACSLHIYRQYRKAFYEKYAAPFIGHFLRTFILICFGLLVFWLAGFIINLLTAQTDYSIYTLFWVLVVVSIYFLAYKIWVTPSILELPVLLNKEETALKNYPVPVSDIAAIEAYMDTAKPYLNPEIKIGDLADDLVLPRHHLSRVINQGFDRNFFDFINGYRIQAFIQARKDEKQQYKNTLELAFQSGFNSKSAFNRAFLKETGKSPREYFETLREIA